jgi:hypothetical protein
MNPWCKYSSTLIKTVSGAVLLGSLAFAQVPYASSGIHPHFAVPPNLQNEDDRAVTFPSPYSDDMPDSPSSVYSASRNHAAVRKQSTMLSESNWKPLTAKQKFKTTSDDLTNVFTQMSLLANARFSQAINDRPYLGPGAAGYFRRYGMDTADTANVDFFQGSLLPWMFHEDPRYIPLDSGTRKRRALYAVTRVLITRKDSGRDGLNKSKLLGAFVSSGVSNLYYPDERNNGIHATTVRALSNIGSDATMNLLKEFWPDVAHKVKLKVWISNIVEKSLRTSMKSE